MRRLISVSKTETGKTRPIPIDSIALPVLQERKQAEQVQVRVFWDNRRDPQHNDRRWLNEALTEARLGDCRRHCNRHTFASRLVKAGVDLRRIAEVMGDSGNPKIGHQQKHEFHREDEK